MMQRKYIIQIEVIAPATTGEREIEDSINAALDEPPCDWQDWTVGAATIIKVKHIATQS